MTTTLRSAEYPLGHTDAEHERLIRQAARVAPITERFFREGGIGLGQRVLDLGSGVGDVAMLAARLVGPSGEVVCIERDPKSIAKARARVTEAGLQNVSVTESDVGEIPDGKPFDAAVGRFILMYLPDPIAALRSAIFWDSHLIDAHILLGRIFLDRGDRGEAIKYAASAINIDPNNQEAIALQRQVTMGR